MPTTYQAEHPPVILANHQEQEAVNRVLTGTALAAHSTGDEVLVYGAAMPPPVGPEPPSLGDPTETGEVQWPVAVTDTDIALVTTPTTVVVGSTFLIDAEYMRVVGVSNPDNPKVARGSYDSAVAAHAAGAAVMIWGTVTKAAKASPAKAVAEPREETKKEETAQERKEAQEEEEAEEQKEKKQKGNAAAKSKSAKKK